MRNITLIGTFGLTDEQIAVIVMWGGYVKKDADTYDEKMGALYHGWNPDRRGGSSYQRPCNCGGHPAGYTARQG